MKNNETKPNFVMTFYQSILDIGTVQMGGNTYLSGLFSVKDDCGNMMSIRCGVYMLSLTWDNFLMIFSSR